MAGVDTMDWLIWDTKSTLGYTMERTNLSEERPILMVLKASRVLQKQGSPSFEELEESLFIIICMNVSFGLIIDMKISIKLC